MKNKMKKINSALGFHIPVIVIAIIMCYPLVWMVCSSLKPNEEVFTKASSLIPSKIMWQNYANGWKGMGGNSFGIFFENSLFIAVLATIGAVFSSTIVAYGFARINFRFKNILFGILMGTMMLPEQVLLIPQYIMFKRFGWINTYLPLIIPHFCATPFFIFLDMQFLRGLPIELDEAAKIDGCNRVKTFIYVLLPLIKPAIITSAIFSFCWRWQDFLQPMIYLSKPQKYTFSIAIKMFSDPTLQSDWGGLFAMATLSLIPVVVIFLFFQKYLVEGIATTGMKG